MLTVINESAMGLSVRALNDCMPYAQHAAVVDMTTKHLPNTLTDTELTYLTYHSDSIYCGVSSSEL